MIFKKKENKDYLIDNFSDRNAMILSTLEQLCGEGEILEDAFVLSEKQIYIYAEIISVKNNVAQISFQLHHEWLSEPIIESSVAIGESPQEAILSATESFFIHILSIYISAMEHPFSSVQVESYTQERHCFNVYRSNINSFGKREGELKGDFWDMLKKEITPRLGNQKAYWLKIFTSKNKKNVICEVQMNGVEINDLSEKLLDYAESWNCLGTCHTEKQYILMIQDDNSYDKNGYTKDGIISFIEKAIALFELCKGKDAYLKLHKQILKLTKDESLTNEIVGLIPEIYCKYCYPKVEFGNKLLLLQKGKEPIELYQSQVQSYAYIEETVMLHLQSDNVPLENIENVIAFSANARAIKKALIEGNHQEELMMPCIGYFVHDKYQLR